MDPIDKVVVERQGGHTGVVKIVDLDQTECGSPSIAIKLVAGLDRPYLFVTGAFR
jgi:hypothetical protein